MQSVEQYVHVLLFRCPECVRPIPSACTSHQKNREVVDSQSFASRCVCGWAGELAGLSAVKHWVELWDGTVAGDGQCEIYDGVME